MNRDARHAYFNLGPGLLNATDVLAVLAETIPGEAAHVTAPTGHEEPAIFEEFHALLPGTDLEMLGRVEFYDAARSPSVALIIATGERRVPANILLTIGVVPPS